MANTIIVPAIVETRRTVCGLQFQRICQAEDEGFVPGAQGPERRGSDQGAIAERQQGVTEHEGV